MLLVNPYVVNVRGQTAEIVTIIIRFYVILSRRLSVKRTQINLLRKLITK